MSFPEHELRPAELVTDHLETPSLDDRTYRVIRLPNQLEALLVHDAEADKASAAMDVNVGNFSDEVDMPGMAHAVEHVSCFIVVLDAEPSRPNTVLMPHHKALIHGYQEVS